MAVLGTDDTSIDKSRDLELPRYKCSLSGLIQDEQVELDNYLISTEIQCLYEEKVFPYLIVNLVLPKAIHLKIQDNYKEILFLFTLNKFNHDGEANKEYKEEIYENIIMKAIDISREVLDPQSAETPEEGTEIADNAPQHEMKLFLFKKEHLYFNKKLNSSIFSECKVHDVLLYLTNKNFQSTTMRFYIGTVDNQREHRQIMTEPLNFIDTIRKLQLAVGIYNNGVQMWFDFKDAFIMDKMKTIENPDPLQTVVKGVIELYGAHEKDRAGNASETIVTFYDEDSNTWILRTNAKPIINRPKNASKEIYGEDIKIMSNSHEKSKQENLLKFTFEEPTNDDKRSKEVMYWNRYTHAIAESEFKVKLANSFNDVELIFTEGNFEAFSPNRIYTIIDKNDTIDMELNGEYKLAEMKVLFGSGKTASKVRASVKARFRRIIITE